MVFLSSRLCRWLLRSKARWWRKALFWLAISLLEPKSISSGACSPILPHSMKTLTSCWRRSSGSAMTCDLIYRSGLTPVHTSDYKAIILPWAVIVSSPGVQLQPLFNITAFDHLTALLSTTCRPPIFPTLRSKVDFWPSALLIMFKRMLDMIVHFIRSPVELLWGRGLYCKQTSAVTV